MGTWTSRGLRGSLLEELINMTNEKYQLSNLALIQKIPTPITPVRFDSKNKRITDAYFDTQSTVDYIGLVQGIPVCFDAKECSKDTFSLANIHDHQMAFMEKFEKQQGIAFFLVCYIHMDRYFYIPYRHMKKFYDRCKEGGRKSFRFEEVDQVYEVFNTKGYPVHYLEALSRDLLARDQQENKGKND